MYESSDHGINTYGEVYAIVYNDRQKVGHCTQIALEGANLAVSFGMKGFVEEHVKLVDFEIFQR